ncbi:MAG TPA: S9 family peptidase, partial [Sphingomicrobium sp.]|nr:S9 family peptidase [Sphingomicrobium sp.]
MDKPVTLPAPPIAEQRPHRTERHGVTIEDPWHWLRDPKYPEVDDPDVLAYLHAENDYFEGWKKQHQGLIDQLFAEMKGRIKEDESSVPIRDGDFLYWWAFRPGAQYRTWYRRHITPPLDGEGQGWGAVSGDGAAAASGTPSPTLPHRGGGSSPDDEVLFDEPVEAEGREYFRLGALEVSPDGKLLATLADYDGSERFELRIRDLATGKDVETVTKVGIGQPVWTSDSKGIVFTEVNDNWRSYRARFHRLGRPLDEDSTLYEETEELGFSVGIGRSHDRSTIFVATGDNATSEVRFVTADDPTRPLTLISRRKPNREYHVDAAHGKLWIHTNDDHVNFRLAMADPADPEAWETVIPGSDQVYLTGATAYRDHLAISSRVEGLDQLILRTYAGAETRIPFAEASYSASFLGNPEFAPAAYRVGYSSMVTPTTVYEYHPA